MARADAQGFVEPVAESGAQYRGLRNLGGNSIGVSSRSCGRRAGARVAVALGRRWAPCHSPSGSRGPRRGWEDHTGRDSSRFDRWPLAAGADRDERGTGDNEEPEGEGKNEHDRHIRRSLRRADTTLGPAPDAHALVLTRSLTTFDEPPGCIVTPYRQSAASIVRF